MAEVKEAPQVEAPENLSPEEMKKRREEITSFYKDNIKHLKTQLEYETLLTDIEKTRAERLQAQIMMAQVYAAQEKAGNEQAKQDWEKEFENAPKRNLKKD